MSTTHNLISCKHYIEIINGFLQKNNLEAASELCIKALFLFPDSFSLNYFLAFIAKKTGQKENALHYANKAAEIYNAGKLTQQDIIYINDLGAVFLGLEQYNQAEQCLAAYIHLKPEDYTGLYNMSQIFLVKKDYARALEWLQKAEKINPTYNIIHNICVSLCNLKKLDIAEEYCLRASKLNPNDWRVYYHLGTIKQYQGLHDEAVTYFNKSLKLSPDSGQAYYCLSGINSFVKNAKGCNEAINKIKNLLEKPDITKNAIVHLNYALGNMYNAQKHYEQAFRYYSNGNFAKSKFSAFHLPKHQNDLERLTKVFSRELIEKLQPFGNTSTVPGFILGMPRSGTTLVEQIIISHSNVYSVGETQNFGNLHGSIATKEIQSPSGTEILNYPEAVEYFSRDEIQRLANQYLHLIQDGKEDILKIFDKMPENAFNIGLIKILFPNATIIHCKRHPLDIVVSMFCSNFTDTNFPNSLENIAEYYKSYSAIMRHWHNIFPDQIYDNYYEELVFRQLKKSREIIKACGLEWEDSSLTFYKNTSPVFTASHAQVKEPMYSNSVFRWKNYEAYLTSVKEILKDEINEYEAEIFKRVPELCRREEIYGK